MLSQIVTNLTFDAFESSVAHKNLVLIYPIVSYRNVFLSYFLQSASNDLIYYRLPHDDIKLSEWVLELSALLPQTDHALQAHNITKLDGKPLGEAFSKHLSSLPKQRVVIYLDEIDRTAQDDQFQAFMQAVVDGLPHDVQLVINSRRLNYHPWIEFINRDLCTVLGTNLRKDSLMFTPQKDQKPQLEVYAFGQGLALVNGREIISWDGALPRQMFYYFMDNHLVTRDQIFHVFWPNLPVKEATNVFHVTKRKISEQITRMVNDGEDHELTVYGAGFYTPNSKIERHYDVADFEAAVNTAYMSEDDDEQRMLYERAIHLYKGDFLTSLDMPWVLNRREKLRMLFVDALIGMARIYKRSDELEPSLSYYIRALREVPLREDVHRDIMLLYSRLGRRDDAIKQYKTLEDLLHKALKVDPDKETRRVYEQIQAQK